MPIVTPNWNLPTPALTDAYNLVGDLATFASAVDGALTTVRPADTGWVNLFLAAGVTGYAAFRRVGEVVTIQFRITADVAAGEVLDPAISGIPPAHLPVADIAWYPIDTNLGEFFQDKVPAAINTAGNNIHIRNTGPTASPGVFSGAVTYIAR